MDDWKPTPRETVKGIRWIIGIGLASFILVLLLASMSIFGWGFSQRATADCRGETKAVSGTYMEYAVGNGITPLVYEEPLPRQDVEPLGVATVEDVTG